MLVDILISVALVALCMVVIAAVDIYKYLRDWIVEIEKEILCEKH